MEEYVKLSDVEELIRLYEFRSNFHDWSDSYKKCSDEIAELIEKIKDEAIQ